VAVVRNGIKRSSRRSGRTFDEQRFGGFCKLQVSSDVPCIW